MDRRPQLEQFSDSPPTESEYVVIHVDSAATGRRLHHRHTTNGSIPPMSNTDKVKLVIYNIWPSNSQFLAISASSYTLILFTYVGLHCSVYFQIAVLFDDKNPFKYLTISGLGRV